MGIKNIIGDAEFMLALEPEELGILILPFLNKWPSISQLDLLTVSSLIIRELLTESATSEEREIADAVAEAWAWLEGQGLLIYDSRYLGAHGIRKLGRRARRIAEQPDTRHALAGRKIPKDSLHPAIRESVWGLYHRAQYEEAITASMKAVEVSVRAAAGYSKTDYGQPMIARAFHADTGPLRDESAGPSERQAMCSLITGAYGLYRNPYAHRNMGQENPDEAAEIIMLANHLLRIIDARVASKTVVAPRED